MDDHSAVDQQPFFMQRLNIEKGADERTIKRAYARELKLIDLETHPAGFQELREAYDTALFWLRHGVAMEPADETIGQAQPREETEQHQQAEPVSDGAGRLDEPPPLDEESVALEVFVQFQQRCACADDLRVSDAWKRELRASIADDRLVNIAAREAFEQQIANLLVTGWRPGHHLLLIAALEVFGWDQDRRRLHALGAAGYTLDCAIDQRAVYDLQSDDDCELQREVIVRVRDLKSPSTGELLEMMPVLAIIEARFPTWLALIADSDNIEHWHQLDKQVPQWRRWLKRGGGLRRFSLGPVWSIILGFGFLMLLLGQLPSKHAVAPQSVAQQQLEEASRLSDNDDAQGALTIYDRIIRSDPRNDDAYGARAMTFIQAGDDKKAELDLDKLETLNKSNAMLPRGRGRLAYNQGRDSDAITAFTRSLELYSPHAYTQMWRAVTYERLKNDDKAMADADAVLSADPARVDARLLRARIFHRRNDKAAELAEAKAVLSANAKDADAYIAAARMYNDIGEPAQALAVVNRGILEAPGEGIYLFRAQLRDAKDFAGKREDYIAALKLKPDSSRALLARVSVELEAGQYDAALAAADSAIHNESTRGERHTLLASRGVALAKQGKKDEADKEFALAKASAATAINLNNLCWTMGVNNVALQTALSFCDASLAQDPESAATLDSKGLVLLRLKRFKESIASYDAALQRREGMASSLYGRGIASHMAGKVKAGDADIKAALQLDPGIADFFTHAGVGP